MNIHQQRPWLRAGRNGLWPAVLVLIAAAGMARAGAAWAQTPAPTPDLSAVPKVHAIAMHGDPKYGPDFEHLDYANPDAPKGGDVKLYDVGSYDSLNPYILEGTTPYAVLEDRVYESLMASTRDEPFSMYGLLAESIQTPEDRSWVVFTLRPEAKWGDGTSVTADDVVYSFNTLIEKGSPFYAQYYGDVDKVTKVDDRTIRFDTKAGTTNRELPLILGQFPIFQKAWWEGRDFAQPSLDVPVSSGPYKVAKVDPGSSITLERDPSYWGKDLPINKGLYNFDTMQWDFYRDSDVALEAFKAGEYDFRGENSSKNWATGYDFPALEDGKVSKEEIPNDNDQGMQGWWFNTRKPIFQDKRVRDALIHAFDFEWTNANLTYNAYTRSNSYFSNSELGSRGQPDAAELAILDPYRDQLPDEVFTTEYVPPSTGGTEEGLRANLQKAVALLEEAGWTVKDNQLVNAEGEPMKFEILLDSPAWERLTGPYIDNLKKLGIDASMRTVDASQYESLVEDFDYDMIVVNRAESESPGNEQRDYWGCKAAETKGSGNYPGICDPVVDALVERVIQAKDRVDLVTATRALDRVLLAGRNVVPQWYIGHDRVAYWNLIQHPETMPNLGMDFDTWYSNADQVAEIRKAQAAIEFVEPTEEGAEAAAETTAVATGETTGEAGGEATAAATAAPESASSDEAGGTGGIPGGTIALVIGAIVLVGAVYLFMRSRGAPGQ